MKRKIELFFLALVILFGIILFGLGKLDETFIDNDYSYVLGKVYKSEAGNHNISFCYKYHFNGKQFQECIVTADGFMQDSIILLKVSNIKPEKAIRITAFTIPKCILENPDFNAKWKELPKKCK